ncbi:MAG: FAD:protein FMN transferase [Leptospirales bacterium]|nr:FAD:protein FMN transferase [Leptospirales bacterium]
MRKNVYVFLILLCSCSYSFEGVSMASRYSVKARRCITGKENAARKVAAVMYSVDSGMSNWSPDSEVSKFNRTNPGVPFTVSPNLKRVVSEAFWVHAQTRGLFDPGIGELIEVWGFGVEKRGPPSDVEVQRALVNSGRSALSLEGNTIRKLRPVALNVTSIADGFAVDLAAEAIDSDCNEFVVEAGGEVKAKGKWPLAIQHPLDPQRVLATLDLEDLAASTSGINIKRDAFGKKLSHIISPISGKPEGHAVSATVFGPQCITADAVSTALILTPETDLETTMSRFPGYSAVVVFEEEESLRMRFFGNVPDLRCVTPLTESLEKQGTGPGIPSRLCL